MFTFKVALFKIWTQYFSKMLSIPRYRTDQPIPNIYMVNIRIKGLKVCSTKPQLQKRGNNRGESERDDGWRV